MANLQYDVIVVGAGPAGLSAARTLSRLGFQVLVVERASGPGEANGVHDAIITPAGGSMPSEPAPGGVYFPQLDLVMPESLVLAHDVAQRFIAPSGDLFETLAGSPNVPAMLIDRPGLLRMVARQAEAAGAEFAWNTPALGLLHRGAQVTGVATPDGDVRADVVLSGEGAARELCGQEMLYSLRTADEYRALVVLQELTAPAVGPGELGRMVTFGHQYSTAPTGFGSVLIPAPGRVVMSYTLFLDHIDCGIVSGGWRHLAEYAHDPRIAGMLQGASVVRRSSYIMPLGRAPESIVRDGFMGIGDAVTPGGYLGILPAMYMGRQAALVAAGAVEEADTSAAALAPFDAFYRAAILPGLDSELRTMNAIVSLDDDEMNRLCATLNALHMPLPFWLHSPQMSGDALAWLGRQLALAEDDLELVDRVLAGADAAYLPAVMPLFAPLGTAVA